MKTPSHAVLARYARSITRLAKHLLESEHFLKVETNPYIIRREKANINFLIRTMRKYANSIRTLCENLGTFDAQEIINDALQAAKQK